MRVNYQVSRYPRTDKEIGSGRKKTGVGMKENRAGKLRPARDKENGRISEAD
jgi:hypothetical protein